MKRILVGDGPARALLLPGNDLCGEFYVGLARELAERKITCELATLPGFDDQMPLAAPSWRALVDQVATALPPILIGHSMGGVIALLTAARQPATLRRLVLMEPAVFPSRFFARAAGRRYIASVVHGDRTSFVNWNGAARRISDESQYPRSAIDTYLRVRKFSDIATSEALFSTVADLYPLPYHRVCVPTLLLEGADSGWRGHFLRRRLRKQLRPICARIPGSGHWMANEADVALARRIADFVD